MTNSATCAGCPTVRECQRIAAECPNVNPVRRSLEAAAASVPAAQPAEPAERPWIPYLSDRADGVKGHYAIARWNPAGYREVWNLWSHRWASASEDVLTLEKAEALLKAIVIPTATTQQSTPANNYHDAYRGAMDEMYEWKKRALAAEETSRQLNRALAEEVNGPTHMGEPVLAAVQQSAVMPEFSEKQIRAGWEATFSTNNPFCPCDLKSFTKAVQWRERAVWPKGVV